MTTYLAALLVLISTLTASRTATLQAQDCFPIPVAHRYVYDEADLLDDSEERYLNQYLAVFTDTTSNVITVLTHPDFCDLEPFEYATEAGEKMGVGRGDWDNGMVIVLRPRSGSTAGAVFIAVGRGLEGAIPDATAQLVVNAMIPAFTNGFWLDGLEVGVEDLALLASGEMSASNYQARREQGDAGQFAGILLIILFLFGFPMLAVFLSARKLSRTNNVGFFAALALLQATSTHRNTRHGYHHFSRGSGGFGGFSGGGGFGGFGGGGFGGGGAGGSF